MKRLKLTIILSCFITAFTCSATKYQIKVLNTPTITIDKKEAKVGDWFDDQSVIVWSKDNQAMRVVSEDNKVFTLSAKLYKEAKAKKFSDFILYTKPLAARGTKELDLIEQLAERFDQDFIMLDEIVIDLSAIDVFNDTSFCFIQNNNDKDFEISFEKIPVNGVLKIVRTDITRENDEECSIFYIVNYRFTHGKTSFITDAFNIEVLPISQ